MKLTDAQQRAVAARGNVLVVAGAGAGKTRTLVSRVLDRLLAGAEPLSLDEMLVVTFTAAAAAGMRQRIRAELQGRLAEQPGNRRLEEQVALLDTAHISTLHSFCLELVREHFHELGLDPQLAVLPEAEAGQLATETLDEILRAHYSSDSIESQAAQQLILEQAGGWDQRIRDLVLQLHNYRQTLADSDGWLDEQLALFDEALPARWEKWFREGVFAWRELWLPVLRMQPAENVNAHRCAAILTALPDNLSRESLSPALAQIQEKPEHRPSRKMGKLRKPIAKFFSEAEFLRSLTGSGPGVDPLAQDWEWVRPHMLTLLRLVKEFGAKFSGTKRDLGGVDFHDLEQFALCLLWDAKAASPTPLARMWSQKLKLLFVDEYQDINQAQDTILRALSRDPVEPNRFLVGDVKQSIYRFRLANPHIFQDYSRRWRDPTPGTQVISLAENFRSHEGLLAFINPLFAALIREEMGGVAYDPEAELRFGDREGRRALILAADDSPRVEVHLRLTGASGDDSSDEEENGDHAALAEIPGAEKEARLVALRLRELKEKGHPVWDEALQDHRPVKWSDMVVLLRSVKNKAEGYAKEFNRLGVPLVAARGGFFENPEITDLLCLLTLLDNPLQDVPALALLRSPLVGLTADELATIRLANRKGRYWLALRRWHESNTPKAARDSDTAPAPETFRKVDLFLKRFGRWRQLSREASLSQRLEAVLDETHYRAWLLCQSRGEQRRANVEQLLALARQFDHFQQQGLYRFLKMIEARLDEDLDHEQTADEVENAVRLMSIHKSKGLEFPIVVLGDLGKRFNFSDLRGGVMLDEEYGLCALVKPAGSGQQYPSLPFWLAQRRQRRESLGEEMRLLYVAMTRARDRLILAGTMSRQRAGSQWVEAGAQARPTHQLLEANCALDWLGPELTRIIGDRNWLSQAAGMRNGVSWEIQGDSDAADVAVVASASGPGSVPVMESDPVSLAALQARLTWQYGFSQVTKQRAKTSVSELRRRLRDETDDEASPAPFLPKVSFALPAKAGGELDAAARGTAHHLFLQRVPLDDVTSTARMQKAAQQMELQGVLTDQQRRALNFTALHGFWSSGIGKQILSQAAYLHRELAFAARFSSDELRELEVPPLPADEFVVVQGVADLAVILSSEIWLLDFKTDRIEAPELEQKSHEYAKQLRLYATALTKIYHRPVRECWLHFLALQKTMPVPLAAPGGRTN